MTTGSVRASVAERRALAGRSRWWNSTGGGSWNGSVAGSDGRGGVSGVTGNGAIKAGDGGKKFRSEWSELDAENWRWMKDARVDVATGAALPKAKPEAERETETRSGVKADRGASDGDSSSSSCATADTAAALLAGGRYRFPAKAGAGSNVGGKDVSAGADAIRNAGSGGGVGAGVRDWLAGNKYMIGAVLLFGYVLFARMMEGAGEEGL